ncbi:hypothetical protein [Fodinicola feengrottensis]|uniref:hypothetical protein n=1 Tax=Fodinicola feengrottensis TaxID=435914 RepID=UPI0028BECE00|nr:hypothetical protein [Fodinicola feengrottensis]
MGTDAQPEPKFSPTGAAAAADVGGAAGADVLLVLVVPPLQALIASARVAAAATMPSRAILLVFHGFTAELPFRLWDFVRVTAR